MIANKKKLLNNAVLLLLLVVFPLISFIYLSGGSDYRREALATRGDFGKMPDLRQFTPVRGQLPAELRGAMTVVGWLDPTKEEGTRLYGRTLDSLFTQFRDSPNLYFTTIVLASDAEAAADTFAETYNLPEDQMLSFLRADASEFAASADSFHLPLGQYDSPGIQPVVALVDSSSTIISHYDLARRDETVGLVQLISLIIPLPEKKEVILQRDKEL